jgi:hypothetical protein
MIEMARANILVTPRRYDIAVKYRFFSHLRYGGDPESEKLYRWHIERRKASNAKVNLGMDGKSGTDQYVRDCCALIRSMNAYGFLPQYAIPIDPDGELLGGAHRLGCALALEIEEVPVVKFEKSAWAPPWNREWFVENGADAEDLARIEKDWLALARLITSRLAWKRELMDVT